MFVLALGVLGTLWPHVMSKPYRLWNRLAYHFARQASLAIMGICFYVLFGAVGRAGALLYLTRPSMTTSLWTPRGTLASTAYAGQYGEAGRETVAENWNTTFLSWALHSRNHWVYCLWPFLTLLAILVTGEEENRTTEANIYTLF